MLLHEAAGVDHFTVHDGPTSLSEPARLGKLSSRLFIPHLCLSRILLAIMAGSYLP